MKFRECVNYFKGILYAEIKKYNTDNSKRQELFGKIDVLNEIIHSIYNDDLSDISIDKIESNKILLGLLLPVVFGTEEANRMYNMILEELSKGDLFKLNLLAKKILGDYEILRKDLLLLDVELKKNVSNIIEYKRILSNYKFSGVITTEQIELSEKLMKKYDFSVEDQIRIFESVRIHNDKCKYNDPKISYTVVNMLETTFEKYDVDGYEDYDKKEKFLNSVDSFYESVKNSRTSNDILMLMPSFFDKTYNLEEFCYIYESVLNRLIDDLREEIFSI